MGLVYFTYKTGYCSMANTPYIGERVYPSIKLTAKLAPENRPKSLSPKESKESFPKPCSNGGAVNYSSFRQWFFVANLLPPATKLQNMIFQNGGWIRNSFPFSDHFPGSFTVVAAQRKGQRLCCGSCAHKIHGIGFLETCQPGSDTKLELHEHIPWEPETLMFWAYDPYIEGLKPSFFMVLGSKGTSKTLF